MRIADKTKEQLTEEPGALRLRIAELEKIEAERKELENVLGQSIERFQALLEEAPIGICNTDLKGKITYVNKRFEEVSGYSRQEVVGKNGLKLGMFSAETLKLLAKRRIERLMGRPPRLLETQFKCKDGHWIWVAIEAKLMKEKGIPIGFQIISRDITERKQAEEALQTEKNTLQSLIDAMEYGLTIQDRDYNIIYQNEPSRIPFGNRLGEKCYRVYAGREKVCKGCPVEMAFKDGKSHTVERKTVKPSGEVTFWENTANPIRDAKGQIISCLEITRNITERKQAEQALVDEATRRRILVDQSLDGIVILDEDAKVVEANQRFAEMLGYTPEEVRELHTWDWDKQFPPEKLLEMGRAVDETGLHLETKHHRKDGSVIDVDISINGAMCGGQKLIFCVCRDVTARKQAEEALKLQTAYFQQLFDSSPDAIALLDTDNRFVSVNQGFEALFGYSAKEIEGQHLIDTIVPEDRMEEASTLSQARFSDKMIRIETVRKRKDGSLVDVSLMGYPIKISEEVVGAYAIYTNITERKRAEEALQAEKNKLQSVIDAMADDLTIQDTDYNIIFQNELSRISSGGDHVGEKCYRAYEGRDEVCDECPVEKALKDGKSHTSERRRVMPSGEIAFWENTANPIKDASGKIVSCLEIGKNITERKRAEEALRESEERFRSIVEYSQAGIMILDDAYCFTYVNDELCQISGYSPWEIIGQDFRQFLDEDSKQLVADRYIRRQRGEEVPPRYEFNIIRKDGQKRRVEISSSVLKDSTGRVKTVAQILDITERKQAEQALADEATRRRILVDQSRDGIVVLDQNGKVYETNQRFAEMLGYTPEEVRELSVWDWEYQFPPEQVQEMIRTVDEAGDHFETRHRRKDGSVYDVEISTNGAIFAGQKLIFCVCRDITARKQAEKALQEAEEKYKNVVEATSDLIWEANEKGVYTFVSPRIKDYLGYEVDEVVGKMRTLDFTPEEEKRKLLKSFKEINTKRVPFSGFEITHLHKNGNPLVFETSGAPFFDDAGNFKGFVGTDKDITERKQMTEALMESQKFSNSLLESSPNPIFVVNPDTSVKYVNPAFEKLTSFTLAEIVGRKAPYPWWLKEQWKEMTASFKNAMVTGGRKSERNFQKKNGERFWVVINSAPVIHEGKLIYFVVNWLDITERKRAEEERLELEQKAHLASRLASVGEMASGIAHEINNPLTAVIGFSQLLLDTNLPDDVKEDISVIHKEAQRAASVAKNLLTFARKHAPVKQLTNINSIIEGVLQLRAYEQSVSNIRVNTHFAHDLPKVMADYSQMQQVFINIILNAETAMLESSNGGTLTVTTRRVNDSVRASFTDTGPGIAKENLNRIFDPFFTTKDVGKGTGLGLSVCHGIIAEHGGRIYARSKSGHGATIVVELPTNAHSSGGRAK